MLSLFATALRSALVAIVIATPAGLCAQPAPCPFVIAATYKVTFAGGMPVITVQMLGHDIHMGVDTGSQMSMLTTNVYNRLNLTGTAPTTGYYAQGVTGTMQINTVIEEDVNFGNFKVHDEVFDIADNAGPRIHGVPITDGIIGTDLLQSFDIGLDFPEQKLILYQRQACTGGNTPWTGSYAPMPITQHKETLSSTIEYDIDNQPLAAIIDTGAQITLVTQDALDRYGIKPEQAPATSSMIGGIGIRSLPMVRERFSLVGIGAEGYPDMPLDVANSPFSQFTDVLIGEDYLATHRVFISNATSTAYLGLAMPAQPH